MVQRTVTNMLSGILANLFRNVKIYRKLKFHHETLPCAQGMPAL